MACTLLSGLLCLWALPAAGFEAKVHGSGTTNPKNFFWEVMQTIESRVKENVRLTYRAVGSSTGQKEFVYASNGVVATPAGVNSFGAGDIPMTADRFSDLGARKMVHVPFCLGAIGVFHSVPAAELGNDGMKLDACLLAKIFSGQITTWDHAEIKAQNQNLAVPPGQKIIVGHRTHGSSSTGGFTKYLDQKCPNSWSLGEGSTVSWPTSNNFLAVEGSQGMTAHIENTPYAIGYIDAGHGHVRSFSEVMIKNRDNNWLTSKDAMTRVDSNGVNGVSAAAANPTVPNADADWSAVDFNDKPGANTWPIVLVSYMYLNKDMSSMDNTDAGLLRAFVDFVMHQDKGQSMLKRYSFDPVPQDMRDIWTAQRNVITWPAGVVDFPFEDSTAAWTGMADSTVSVKRSSYTEWKLEELALALEDTQTKVNMMESHLDDYGMVPLHGSGTTNPKNWFALAMKTLEHRARVPMLLTYRAVGSSTGQAEFVGQESNGYKSYNHFGAGDIPMKQSNYQELSSKVPQEHMVHLPFALGAIAVFHSVPMDLVGDSELKLDACLLAKIFSGTINTWDHQEIKAQNPNMNVGAGVQIKVGHRKYGSSSTGGFTGYLEKKCPASLDFTAGSTVTWPDQSNFQEVEGSQNMQKHVADQSYAIGYMDAGHGYDYNLAEVALTNLNGRVLTSKTAAMQGGVAAAGEAGVTNNAFPTDNTADWSQVNLYDMAGPNTWPIVLVSYMYVKKDQTMTNLKTASALRAFVDYVLNDADNLCAKFGFTPPPTILKARSLTAAESISYPAAAELFMFESSTDVYNGMGENVLSVKRIAWDDYERGTLQADVAALKTDLASIKASQEASLSNAMVSLHGSGTTNPKNWFAKAMKLIEHRTPVPLLLTYRAVGSSTGQAEFVGQTSNGFESYNHFGAGDIPMAQTEYQKLTDTMVHLPFALGAIGVFHSVPGAEIGSGELKLDACLLAKIFGGTITTWDHADIKAQNPGLSVPTGQRILVGHRTKGSSSTGGFTSYLNAKCNSEWTLGTGSTLNNWPTTAGFMAVQGSQGMQDHITGQGYAIGYMDAGHGYDAKLAEVALTNRNGRSLTSADSAREGGIAAAGEAAVTSNEFPSDHTADWSAVNLNDMAGDFTWPIVLVSYMYVKQDQTATNPKTAAALKAFIEFILKNRDNLCSEFGFTPLPTTLLTKTLTASGTISYPAMDSFDFEESTNPYGGMANNMISVMRVAWDDYERDTITSDVAMLKTKIEEAEAARKADAQKITDLQASLAEDSASATTTQATTTTTTTTQASDEAAGPSGAAIGAIIVAAVSVVASLVAVALAFK